MATSIRPSMEHVHRFTTLATLLFTLACPARASDLHIRIDDVKFDAGAIVKFLEIGATQVPVKPEALSKMTAAPTEDHRYTVFADIDGLTVYSTFENYEFYVRRASGPSEEALTRFTVQATPYDIFPDQNKTLHIHLMDGQQERVVELMVPVHSLKAGGFLWAKTSGVAKVRLSGDTVYVDILNKYLMPIRITDATAAKVQEKHWISQPALQTKLPLDLSPDESNNRVTLEWKVQPRASGVLRDSLIPISQGSASPSSTGDVSPGETDAEKSDDYLDFAIDYAPAQGGYSHTLKVSRYVHFYPSFPALVSVAILGAVLAGLVMFFGIRKDSGLWKFFNYMWPNIILAVIVEFIAIALFSFDNSKVQIGVVNLNPTLLIPATCLGAASVFYGFQIVEKWLGKAGSQAAKQPAGRNTE